MTFASGVILLAVLVLTGFLANYLWRILPGRRHEHTVDSLRVFGTAIELRCPGQTGLTDRVVSLSMAVGRAMELSQQELNRLEVAARLRDIGICAIPWQLMNGKTPMEWSEAEAATYRKHPEIGGAMMELVPSLRNLAQIVRCHQTAFDGSDGPTFPQGVDLPLESRILAVTCAYVTCERFQGHLLAWTQLEDQSGTKFDPAVVQAILGVLPSQGVNAGTKQPSPVG